MTSPSYISNRRILVSENAAVFQLKRIPALLVLIFGLFLALALLVFITVAIARLQPLPQPLDLSASDLAGDISPQHCEIFWDQYMPRCFTVLLGLPVYLQPLTDTKTITRTVDTAQFFTLGQLVVAWGTPTGVLWQSGTIRVYWTTRSALLVAHS